MHRKGKARKTLLRSTTLHPHASSKDICNHPRSASFIKCTPGEVSGGAREMSTNSCSLWAGESPAYAKPQRKTAEDGVPL